jgi:hypothetical protein
MMVVGVVTRINIASKIKNAHEGIQTSSPGRQKDMPSTTPKTKNACKGILTANTSPSYTM